MQVGTTIQLTWSDNSSLEGGYRVERRIDDGPWGREVDLAANTESHTVNSILDKKYEYRVQALGNGSEVNSDFSETAVLVAGDINRAAIPTDLSATQSGSEVILSWTDNSSVETGYRVQRRIDGGPWRRITADLSANTVTYTDPGRLVGPLYEYRIQALATTPYIASRFSSITDITLTNTMGARVADASSENEVQSELAASETETVESGIEEVLSDLRVYPNPTIDFVTVTGANIKSVEIADMSGREMLVDIEEISEGNYRINLSGAQFKGIYLVRIHSENGHLTRRIIKN